MSTTYAGIDYSGPNATCNRDAKTGIRYGIIPVHSVMPEAWYDSAEPQYTPSCPHCGAELKKGFDQKRCGSCRKAIDSDLDFQNLEPDCNILDDGEYKAFDDSCGDIMITKSPYYTYAQFCSPCAPGACHLGNPLESPAERNKCFCFGHDFFDSGTAPYPVYSVATGELIPSDKAA